MRIRLLIVSFSGILLLSPGAYAVEEMSSGRKIWDTIMLWFNFGILVFLFIKYARKPLMDFLHGRKDTIEKDINHVQGELQEAEALKESEAENLSNLEERLEEIRVNLVEIGRKEKEKIIEEGKSAAAKMIRDAEVYSQQQIEIARKTLSDEMVDTAVNMVQEKLSRGISDEDNEKLVTRFLQNLEMPDSKRHFELAE
jgi:F-type H+-transporting ATPase subunit b